MKGLLHKTDFDSKDEKAFTNIRRVLIEAGITPANFASSEDVPYDFSYLYSSGEVGQLVKDLLQNRLKKIGWDDDTNSEFFRDFYEQCYKYEFHKVFSLTKQQFASCFPIRGSSNKIFNMKLKWIFQNNLYTNFTNYFFLYILLKFTKKYSITKNFPVHYFFI